MNKIKNWLIRRWRTHKYILSADLSTEVEHFDRWLPSFLFSFSFALLSFLFFSLFISSIGFFLRVSITQFHFPVSIGFTVLSTYLMMKLIYKKRLWISLVIVLALVVSCLFLTIRVSEHFYDLDYDSQWYHLETVIALNKGWNPFYHQLTLKADPDISSQNILNSYPKAQEIIETVIYKSTGKIESSKSFNLLTIVMAFCFSLSALLRFKKLSPILAILGAVLLVMNPITLIQYLSAYIDGSMYNFILSLIALLTIFYLSRKNLILIPIILCVIVLWNIKLTAIFYSAIIFATFLIYAWYTEKILLFFKSIQAFLISAFLALFLIGFHPFITNMIWHRNPFYSGGITNESYIEGNAPASMAYLQSPVKFVLSIFSKPEVLRGENKQHQLKIPFTLSSVDFDNLIDDKTVGGFGSLFSGIFIISVIGTIFIFISKHSKAVKRGVLFLIFMLLISSAFFPTSNYARFITPFWIFPCVVVIYLLSERRLISNLIGISLIITILANNYLITKEYVSFNLKGAQEIKTELQIIKEISDQKPIAVDFDIFRSNRARFKEAEINFIEQSSEKCTTDRRRALSKYISESKIILCYQL